MLKFSNILNFPLASFARFIGVTDEALIAETAVWPNFFLMNVFFALKGSKLFIIKSYAIPKNFGGNFI